MKTVTHKGKVYQLHSMYAFYDAGMESNFEIHELCGISSSGNFEDENTDVWGCAANELPTKLGTIEDAPLELEDNTWYMCHWEIQTDNESTSHHEEPKKCRKGSGGHGSFHGVPERALLFTPLYKMIRAN